MGYAAEAVGDGRRSEQGFTLIEAMVAMVILIFGLAAIANLMVVAGTSNTAANHSTAAALAASQQMERIKSVAFPALPAAGGDVDNDVGATGRCGATPVTATFNCDTSATLERDFAGVGTMHVRWQIGPGIAAGGTATRFIQVSAESRAPAMFRRSRVVLTTFRTDNP